MARALLHLGRRQRRAQGDQRIRLMEIGGGMVSPTPSLGGQFQMRADGPRLLGARTELHRLHRSPPLRWGASLTSRLEARPLASAAGSVVVGGHMRLLR